MCGFQPPNCLRRIRSNNRSRLYEPSAPTHLRSCALHWSNPHRFLLDLHLVDLELKLPRLLRADKSDSADVASVRLKRRERKRVLLPFRPGCKGGHCRRFAALPLRASVRTISVYVLPSPFAQKLICSSSTGLPAAWARAQARKAPGKDERSTAATTSPVDLHRALRSAAPGSIHFEFEWTFRRSSSRSRESTVP